MRRAADAEKACRTNEAVTAYALLLRNDPSFEPVVGPRLVSLFIGSGQASEALAWATRLARRHPDPAVYLAGVHGRLGQWKEAEFMLRKTLAGERDARRRARLMWELADSQESQGDTDTALATLTTARDSSPDEALRSTSAERLEALRTRTLTAETNQAKAPHQPKGRDNP